MKGVFDEARQWSAYKPSDDTPVFTCWHTVLDEGVSEVVQDPKTGQMLMVVPPGKWASKPKGKIYLAMVEECYSKNQAAEIILLCGRRSDTEAHEVYATAIDNAYYYVRFTHVDKLGGVRGVFLPL